MNVVLLEQCVWNMSMLLTEIENLELSLYMKIEVTLKLLSSGM
jgi:hypothetical protein